MLVDAAESRLAEVLTVRADPAGLHLLARLAPGFDDVAVQRAAMARGVRSWALSKFYLRDGPASGALVLGYGGFGERAIREGVETLGAVLSELSRGRS